MEAPTISDAKKNLGEDFAQKLFCNCDPNFREDFGLQPPLKGPIGGDLWTSPSDLLIGKVCLKPPLTSKHIRALTHQGIMSENTFLIKYRIGNLRRIHYGYLIKYYCNSISKFEKYTSIQCLKYLIFLSMMNWPFLSLNYLFTENTVHIDCILSK